MYSYRQPEGVIDSVQYH